MKQPQIKDIKMKIIDLRQAKKKVLWSLSVLEANEVERLTYKAVESLNNLINHYVNELEYIEKRNNYQFYFQYQPNGKKYIVNTRFVINPRNTKEYQNLKKNFEQNFIFSFGYDTIRD